MQVASKPGVNFMEPSWTADNKLMYICDKTEWWNLYIVNHLHKSNDATCVHQVSEEIGQPCWDLGNRTYCPNPKNSDQVVMLYSGVSTLMRFSMFSQQTYIHVNIV